MQSIKNKSENMRKNIKYISAIVPIAAFIFIGLAFVRVPVKAQSSSLPVNGYAWSDNVGWISFNGTSTDNSPYQVSYNSNTGNLSGYAWSDGIGWVSFNQTTGCPSGTCQPNINISTGAVTGWARACAGTYDGICGGGTFTYYTPPSGPTTTTDSRIDGWDGWISLSGTNYPSPTPNGTRGVTYASSTGNITGYAWGSDVVGWISFAGSTTLSYPGVTVITTCSNGATDYPTCSVCSTSQNMIGGTCQSKCINPLDPNSPYSIGSGAIFYRYSASSTCSNAQDIQNRICTAGNPPALNGSYSYPSCSVFPLPPALTTAGIVLTPQIINSGSSQNKCVLSWTLTGGAPDTCTLISSAGLNIQVATSSSGTYTPSSPIGSTTTYTLTCSNAGGSVVKHATCRLNPNFKEF